MENSLKMTKFLHVLLGDAFVSKFRETVTIYGLGDTQVKRLFDEIALADDHLQ